MNNSSSSFECKREGFLCLGIMNKVYGHYIINICLNFVLALSAMLGNGLVLAAYYYSPSLRKPANTILMSLAATDFLTGVTSQPLYIWEKILMSFGECTRTVCIVTKLEKFFLLSLIGGTVLNLSLATLDRYIAVCHTYEYPELVTNSRVKPLLGIIWVLLITFSAASLNANVAFFLAVVLSVNIAFIVVLYFKLYREIRHMEANAVQPMGQNNQEEERKVTKTLGIILGSLFLSFIPFIGFGILNLGHRVPFSKENKELVLLYGSTAALSNSATNVFIYYWRNEDMRKAMQKVIRKMRFGNQQGPIQ